MRKSTLIFLNVGLSNLKNQPNKLLQKLIRNSKEIR
jgi:hypothetical protein